MSGNSRNHTYPVSLLVKRKKSCRKVYLKSGARKIQSILKEWISLFSEHEYIYYLCVHVNKVEENKNMFLTTNELLMKLRRVSNKKKLIAII